MEVFHNQNEMNREVILKTNIETQRKTLVHAGVSKYLKIHQIDGIKFLFENCYEQNSGCILAHCMGLGKTLQVIALLHAVINSKEYRTNKVLVLCTVSTIINWKEEIARWLGPIDDGHRKLQIFELDQKDDIHRKISMLGNWSKRDCESPAVCLVMGYESFRNLVNFHLSKANAKKYTASCLNEIRQCIQNYLLESPDIVICDEGHVIKNSTAATTLAVNQIQTKRRIILTGTPMQNHLMEYFSMVNFVKPNFLGTKQYFNEYFAEPIKSGQHADSSQSEIKYMKQRSYALNKKLSKIVQRREISLLKDFLPEKFEFVLFIPLTNIQYDLYEYFLRNRGGVIEYKRLFGDYTCLRKIWTHLKVLDNAHQKSIAKTRRATNNDDENDNNDEEEYLLSGGLQMVDNDWWRKVIDKKQLENASSSYKMIILFEILKECQRVGDKCVIFSSFVEVLNVVEFFMQQIDQQRKKGNGLENFNGPWQKNEDYYRLDGSTPKERRQTMIKKFNDVKNKRTNVFLISAQAGGQGINLFGANRLILLDTSWNPARDQQSIFRIYRMGQTKHCYIYRLLSMGTMEEKIYSRSVTKQAMSCRVVDKQQIDRHYSMNELEELYSLTKQNMETRPAPIPPKDGILAHLLQEHPDMVYKYIEHDSLLANIVEEELNEVEKNEAWQRCLEQNLQMEALSMMSNEQQSVTSSYFPSQDKTSRVPFNSHNQVVPESELKERSSVKMAASVEKSITEGLLSPVEDVDNGNNDCNQGSIDSSPLAIAKEIFGSNDLPNGLCSVNEMELECSEDKETTSIDSSNDYTQKLPLSYDDNNEGRIESSPLTILKEIFEWNVLNGPSTSNEKEHDCTDVILSAVPGNQKMDTLQSLERSEVKADATLIQSFKDDTQGLENVENGNKDTCEERTIRSLSDFVEGLLHTLNHKYARSPCVPDAMEDYTIKQEIIRPNQFNNFEYRIALKRSSNSTIHRPIKRLNLSLEIDPAAAVTVNNIISTLPLTTECQLNEFKGHSLDTVDGNLNFANLNGGDIENSAEILNEAITRNSSENEEVCSMSAEQSIELPPSNESVVDECFNADLRSGKIDVSLNDSEGEALDSDCDESMLIVGTSDAEDSGLLLPIDNQQQLPSIAMNEDEVELLSNEVKQSTESIIMNELSHCEGLDEDEDKSSSQYSEETVVPTSEHDMSESEMTSTNIQELYEAVSQAEPPTTMTKIKSGCALM